jgi:peroxiredoxin
MKRLFFTTLALLIACGAWSTAASAAQPVTPEAKTPLFNGKDLSGWDAVLPLSEADPTGIWSVKDGVLRCEGRPFGFLRTEKTYTDYTLHLEWRWPLTPTNSGVLLHASKQDRLWPTSIEAQLMHRNAGDFWLIGGASGTVQGKTRKSGRAAKMKDSSEKPAGRWNTYEIVCDGNTIRLTVNGVHQNTMTGAAPHSGHILLQSEGSPIEFRNIYIEPLGGSGTDDGVLDFTLPDEEGEPVNLADYADKIVVLEWVNYDCPYSKRHYDRNTFDELATKYRDEGVVWFAVNSTHYARPSNNKEFAEKHDVVYPILDDHSGKIGHKFDAKTTPDIRIIKDGKVVYTGGIDDDPRGNKDDPTNYVDRALAELVAGEEVSTPETRPYGCSVKYAK